MDIMTIENSTTIVNAVVIDDQNIFLSLVNAGVMDKARMMTPIDVTQVFDQLSVIYLPPGRVILVFRIQYPDESLGNMIKVIVYDKDLLEI
jgi:hypothetical protein